MIEFAIENALWAFSRRSRRGTVSIPVTLPDISTSGWSRQSPCASRKEGSGDPLRHTSGSPLFSLSNLNGKPMCAHGYKRCFCDNSPAYKRELLGRSQSVLPHSHNILTGVEVSVSVQSATWTVLGAVREGELLPMSTARAILTRLRGGHRDKLATGPCCLVRKPCCERTPRCLMDALGQTVVR